MGTDWFVLYLRVLMLASAAAFYVAIGWGVFSGDLLAVILAVVLLPVWVYAIRVALTPEDR